MMVEELMIGDWVSWYGSPHEIDINDFEEAHNYANPLINIYESVPITPEILLKNGFSLCLENPDVWVLQGITYRISLYQLDETRWILKISSLEDGSYLRDKTIRHIHQLQHFMRDFEIEKEIEL